MAALLRPSMARQACSMTPSKHVARGGPSPLTRAPFSTIQTYFTARNVNSALPPTVMKSRFPGGFQVAAFQTSTQRDLLPPLPQRINGTANDPAPIPERESLEGAYHWAFERAISIALVPVTIAPFIGGSLNPIMDTTLCALLVIHTHIGFRSIIIDYLPMKRVPKTRFLFDWGALAGAFVVAAGLYEFETNDVGLTEGIKRIWRA